MESKLVAEIDIIRRAQRGSQDAYGELYQRHLDAIYQYIDKRVDGGCDTEDLTQTVFVKAWQGLRDYQPADTPFRAWLYRIAHNTVIDHYRANKQRSKHSSSIDWDDLPLAADAGLAPDMQLLRNERKDIVHRALATLRPSYQQVLTQRFLHDQDYSEAAADLGLQVNNLRVLQHRALEALRRVLSQDITLALAVVATLLILGREMVIGTANSLPGDGLYPARIIVEQTTLLLADDDAKVRLHSQFADQRISELRQLSQLGASENISTTAQNLAEHIQSAAAELGSRGEANPALKTQFAEQLATQSDQVQALLASDAPTLQQSLQPALDAISAAKQATQKELAPPQNNLAPQPVEQVVLPTPTPTPTLQPTATFQPTPTIQPTTDAATPIATIPDSSINPVTQPASLLRPTALPTLSTVSNPIQGESSQPTVLSVQENQPPAVQHDSQNQQDGETNRPLPTHLPAPQSNDAPTPEVNRPVSEQSTQPLQPPNQQQQPPEQTNNPPPKVESRPTEQASAPPQQKDQHNPPQQDDKVKG